MTRNEMQELLEEDDFRYIMNKDGGLEMLRTMLAEGFSGYNNFTEQMLLDEIKGRGFA
jgi:hypothetical protein